MSSSIIRFIELFDGVLERTISCASCDITNFLSPNHLFIKTYKLNNYSIIGEYELFQNKAFFSRLDIINDLWRIIQTNHNVSFIDIELYYCDISFIAFSIKCHHSDSYIEFPDFHSQYKSPLWHDKGSKKYDLNRCLQQTVSAAYKKLNG